MSREEGAIYVTVHKAPPPHSLYHPFSWVLICIYLLFVTTNAAPPLNFKSYSTILCVMRSSNCCCYPSGADLDQIERETKDAIDSMASMGCALTACTLPGQPVNQRLMGLNRMEFGLGIHGEPGMEVVDSVLPADDVVDKLMEAITGPPNYYLPLHVRSKPFVFPLSSLSLLSALPRSQSYMYTRIDYINQGVLFYCSIQYLTVLLYLYQANERVVILVNR